MANLSYDDILTKKVAFGTAAGVIDRLDVTCATSSAWTASWPN